MSLRAYVIGQFRQPRGWVGGLAGWIMAARPSNRLRNAWTLDLLDLRPGDRVLEIGHGPGIALALAAARVPEGRIVGLDHSAAMHSQAARRNRTAIREGRVRLLVGSIEDPAPLVASDLAQPFDKIFAVNVTQFWDDPVAVFRLIETLLVPDGTVAITHQPRAGVKTDAAALRTAETIRRAMADAGLTRLRIERLTMLSPNAVCVLGMKNAS